MENVSKEKMATKGCFAFDFGLKSVFKFENEMV